MIILTLAADPWWSASDSALFGTVGGSISGLYGGFIGLVSWLFVRNGTGRNVVYGSFAGMIAFGVIGLTIGLAALASDQLYHVWYPALLMGVVLSFVSACTLPGIVIAYRQAERRAMDADLIRGGAAKNAGRRATPLGIALVALIAMAVTAGITAAGIAALKPLFDRIRMQDGQHPHAGAAEGTRAALDSPAAEPADPHRFTLANGVAVRLLPVADIGWVGVIASYDVGFAHDPEGYPQLAHLVEHLRVTGPVGDLPANARWQELNAIGSANAETQPHFTYYDYLLPADKFALAIETEAARLTDLVTTQDDITREGPRAAMEATNIAERSPQFLHKFALMAAVQSWRYGAEHVDIATGLEHTPIEVAQAFLDEHYRTDALTLSIAGDFDPAAIRQLLDRTVGAVPAPGQPRQPRLPSDAWAAASDDLTITWDLPATVLAAAAAPPASAQDRAILGAVLTVTAQPQGGPPVDGIAMPMGSSVRWPIGELPAFILGTAAPDIDQDAALAGLAAKLTPRELSRMQATMAAQSAALQMPELTPELVRMQAKQIAAMRGLDESHAMGMVALQMALNEAALAGYTKPEPIEGADTWRVAVTRIGDELRIGSIRIVPAE